MRRCATTLEAEMTPDEHAFLLNLLQTHGRTGRHLEIGTAAGGTLCAMLAAFPSSSRPPFSVVDPMRYFPDQLSAVRRNLIDHGFDPDGIDFRVGTSSELFPQATQRGDRFDFLLIDGCHKIQSVMLDLKWTRLLNTGGLVCFHDYTPKHRGVWLAVNRFLSRHRNYQIAGQAGTLLAVRKLTSSSQLEIDAADEWYARAWYLPLQVERKWQRWRKAA